ILFSNPARFRRFRQRKPGRDVRSFVMLSFSVSLELTLPTDRYPPGCTASGLTQPEKLSCVGRNDRDAKDGAVAGDYVGERSPEAAGADAESAFHREAD